MIQQLTDDLVHFISKGLLPHRRFLLFIRACINSTQAMRPNCPAICMQYLDAAIANQPRHHLYKELIANHITPVSINQYFYTFSNYNPLASLILFAVNSRASIQPDANYVVTRTLEQMETFLQWHNSNVACHPNLSDNVRIRHMGNCGIYHGLLHREFVPPDLHGLLLTLKPALKFRAGLIPQIAKDIYEREAWQELPMLADALIDADIPIPAGHKHATIVAHLRDKTYRHHRGCWALDALMSKISYPKRRKRK